MYLLYFDEGGNSPYSSSLGYSDNSEHLHIPNKPCVNRTEALYLPLWGNWMVSTYTTLHSKRHTETHVYTDEHSCQGQSPAPLEHFGYFSQIPNSDMITLTTPGLERTAFEGKVKIYNLKSPPPILNLQPWRYYCNPELTE